MTVREILKILYDDGWTEVDSRKKGSHVQLKHPVKLGKLMVPSHKGDIPVGTLNSVLKQAGLKR